MSSHDTDTLWRGLKRVFRLPFNRARLETEIDDELRFHLEGRIEDLMRREGLDRDSAEREALRRFGDLRYYRGAARDIDQATELGRQRMEFRDSLGRELRHATRSLARSRVFTLVSISTLALGIGAAAAIFTLLDAVVLRPLPYPNADRLVSLSSPVPKLQGQSVWGLARHEMFYFLERGRSLENLGVYSTFQPTVAGDASTEAAERVRAVQTSASLFQVLGFAPLHGRLLRVEENSRRPPTTAVLGYDFWTRRFGGDPQVIGRALNIEGMRLEIVGVLPPRATLPDEQVDLWVPAHVDSTVVMNNHTWAAIGLLRPGYTAEDAMRELAPLTARLPEVFPDVYGAQFIQATGFSTKVVSLRDAVVGDLVTRALWALFGAVALVLLIAAANIANLFLVRFDARRRELAMRTALGATRSHLAWRYLTEGGVIAIAALVLGVALAQVMLRLMLVLAPSDLPRVTEVALGGAGVAFAVGVAVLSALAFGLLPVVGSRFDLASLRDSGRGSTSSRGRMALRRLLVATQMSLAVVLLASAGLMIRTYRNLQAVQPGFRPEGVLTLQVSLPGARYSNRDQTREEAEARTSLFHEQVTRRLRELPGVTHAAFGTYTPLLSGDWCYGVMLEGPTPEAARGVCPPVAMVSPDYFDAMGIRVEGSVSDWAAVNAGAGGLVVSRSFAEHHWPGEDAFGKGVRFNGRQPPFYRVSGIAEDVRGNGLDEPPVELVYFPVRSLAGSPLPRVVTDGRLVVRTTQPDPADLAPAVTRVVRELEPLAVVDGAQTMAAVVARSQARRSFTMALLGIAAGIALLLSAVGIYGVTSYVVTQRRGEIGVRMALGAQVREVTGMILRQSLVLAAAGVVIGTLAALAVTRVLGALLYGVAPNDPLILAAVPLVLLLVALLASVAPARRAANTDPVEALRSD